MQDILGFKDEFRWLSNFTECKVEFDGDIYSSVEHAYQAAKTFDLAKRKLIRESTAGKAKQIGKTIELVPDWEQIKLEVMRDLLMQKFSQEPFRSQLIATGDCFIEETNWWGDVFWGVCCGKGLNHLGRMIMDIRADLQSM